MLSLLEVERFEPRMDEVTVWLVLDDEAAERAYRVEVTYDALDEQVSSLAVHAWWRCDLVEHPMTDAHDDAVLDEIERFVDCHMPMRDEALDRQRDYAEDAAIYDKVA